MPETDVSLSIVMPVFDAARFVEEAVHSVRAQTFGDFELIAIDDGSTDGGGEILERLAAAWPPGRSTMRVLRQPNRGAAAARNAGLRVARGRLVGFFDADDRLRRDALARLVEALDDAPDLDLVFPLLNHVDEDGADLGIVGRVRGERFGLEDLLGANPVHSATAVLLRSEAVAAVGLFDETLRACVDLDYWVRVAALRSANLGCVRAVLADYRRREGQITGDWRRMEAHWARVFDKAFAAAPERVGPIRGASRGRACLYWSAIAYANGDHAAARRLCAETWRRAPFWALRDRQALVRTLACLASLMPAPLHDGLRRRFNALRTRLGFDFS